MGVVFQDFRLLPDKTVYDNVAYAMYIVRATPRHIRSTSTNDIITCRTKQQSQNVSK